MPPLRAPAILRLFAFGAVVGSVLDGFHTYSGATAYPSPVAFRMAWWTPPLFGGAFVLMGLLYAATRRTDQPAPEAGRAATSFAAFSALYFASGFLPAPNAVKLAVLVAGAALLVALVDRSRAAVLSALVAAVVGPSFEMVIVHFGAFSHLQPDLIGVPVWLPGLYLASGPGLGPAAFRVLVGALATRPLAAAGARR